MNTPTPTPRTDAAWSATFDSEQMSAGQTARALRECSQRLETELATLTAERDQLRAEVERLRAGIGECLRQNGHLADGEDCTLIELKRCLRDSRVERSDEEQVEAWASWANTCIHHNDKQRVECPVCLVAALTAERDQLRAALALGQINCDAEYDDLRDERDAANARAELAEAFLRTIGKWEGAK